MEQVITILILAIASFATRWAVSMGLPGRWKLKRIRRANFQVFDANYIEVKAYYLHAFGELPCVNFIDNLDMNKTFEYFRKDGAGELETLYQSNYYHWKEEALVFNRTLFRLRNKIVIELEGNYAQVAFGTNNYEYAQKIITTLVGFKAAAKTAEFQIEIITTGPEGLQLRQLSITEANLDLDLFYNDDFRAVNETIVARLQQDADKGIILLHGLPGTGKTTYLRCLIGKMKKRVLFVSPSVAGNLMNPEFIDLLISNPNTVLIIEDAENILLDRKINGNSSVSNLLNISDGLLSDCLNVQIICTFNSALSLVDTALLRKGRLNASYEFGKLDIKKAQRLSDHFGHNRIVKEPMTIAEIANATETEPPVPNARVVGFRREPAMV
jgi:hypothetical protein